MVRTLSPQKKENLLNTALRLFVANGQQNTSTAEIAREAGIASGTLFLYFPTKQTLIDELVLKISREQSDTIKALLKPHYSARESFFLIWQGSIHWFIENMDAYSYVQRVRDSLVVSEEVVQENANNLAYYFEAIQKGFAEGSIQPYPAELIGEILYQDIVAVMNLMRINPNLYQQEEVIRMGFDIFWNGIKSGIDTPQGENHAI